MSSKALADAERASLDLILEDLRYLFDKVEIDSSDLNTVLNNLKSSEAKTYLNNLFAGSKPETALRESFFTSDSTFAKFLYGYAQSFPEVVENGFVDYLIKDELGHTVVLELKSLFYSQKEKNKAGAIKVKKLKQQVLDWSKHKEQIKSYIPKGDYVILTNLKEWFFFSRSLNPINPAPFDEQSLHEFIVEYENYGKNFKEFCDRKEYQAVRYELDKEFLGSLSQWVKKLSAVKFKADENRKLELIIGLINKFIFIQTLDDYGVIRFKWIQNNWQYYESQWVPKGKAVMLEEFVSAVDKWFFKYYDTELFRGDVLKHVEKEKKNIELFYEILRDVLGVTYLQKPIGFKGIIQYNFRLIDEDVLGKAYETFLAGVRHEEGVYYTPKYITQSIVENTVGEDLDALISQIEREVLDEDFESAKRTVTKFVSIKVLDPACGSGSFLIKAIRTILDRYDKLYQFFDNVEKNYVKKYSNYLSSLSVPQEVRYRLEFLSDMKRMTGPSRGRELISRILVRHIHGNDLDRRALEIAKVNIWLEAIKLSPKEFRYDKLPPDTNYILPNLRMNLCNGDSIVGMQYIVGMPEDAAVKYLYERHQAEIINLSELRRQYLEDPTNPKLVEEIEKVKHLLEKELNVEFAKYLTARNLPSDIIEETKPFHWALGFWYVFFNNNGKPMPKEDRGFDAVIGNPPYVDSETMTRHFPILRKYCTACYECASGNWDLFCVFVERSILNVKKDGRFGFILPNKLLSADYADATRNFIKKYQVVLLGDYSRVKVFDAAVYPIVLVLKKSPWNEANKLDVDIFQEVIGKDPEVMRHNEILLKELYNLPGNIWSPAVDPASEVLSKVQKKSTSISEHYEVLGSATVSEAYEISAKLKELKDYNKQDYLKLVNTGTIDKYISLWEFTPTQFIKKTYSRPIIPITDLEEISQKRLQESLMEKVIIAGMSLELECFHDSEEHIAGKSTVIVLNGKASLKGLVGVLNSKACSFMLRKLFGGLALGGGYLTVGPPQIRKLPIPLAFLKSKKKQKQLEKLVDRVSKLTKSHYKFVSLWHEWSTKMKNDETSFLQILQNDMKRLRDGEFRKVWTSKASFYPNTETKELSREFAAFRISGALEKSTIRIYGLDENNREEPMYEMDFSSRDLMLHVYFSIIRTLRSRARIKTLLQLFAKTKISLIKEVNRDPTELTSNIIAKTKDEFEKWLQKNKIENVEADIVKIDNEVEDLEAEIDALVFKLYGLEEDEIKVVFDSLKTLTIYQGKVLEFFRTQ